MRCNNIGLILVELIVVVAIMSILILSLSVVFKSGFDAWSRSDDRLEIYQNARVTIGQLSKELAGAFVQGNAEFNGSNGTGTDGSDILTFVAYLNEDIYKFKYELAANNILQRKYIKNPFDYTSTTYDKTIDFATMVSDIQFEYCNDGGSWAIDADWSTPAILPDAVKIRVTFVDSEPENNLYPFETTVYLPNSE